MNTMNFGASKGPRVVLGTSGNGLRRSPFVLKESEIATHKHIQGVTGMGKSMLIAAMFVQLLNQGVAAALIDPHSDLALDVMTILVQTGYFEAQGFRKLLYVDFSRQDAFIPFNILKQPYPPHVIARNLVEVCHRVWPSLAEGAAANFDNVLLASSLVLAENGLPFTCLPKLLTDREYREKLLGGATDSYGIDFFHDRFDAWGRGASTLIESTLRRIYLSSFTPVLRYSLGQLENRLNFRALMDEGVSVIFNLGGLDEETQRFLGCLITVGYETAALSRADMPLYSRSPYHLIMDEFSMFAAQSEEALSRVLSLARKYGLFLTMSHQTWGQVSQKMRGALQNCTEVTMKLGRADAKLTAETYAEFDPYLIKHEVDDPNVAGRTHPVYFRHSEIVERWTQDIEGLRPREAYVRTGERTAKIKTLTVPPSQVDPVDLRNVIDWYATNIMTPRNGLEQLISPTASTSGEPTHPSTARRSVRVS